MVDVQNTRNAYDWIIADSVCATNAATFLTLVVQYDKYLYKTYTFCSGRVK